MMIRLGYSSHSVAACRAWARQEKRQLRLAPGDNPSHPHPPWLKSAAARGDGNSSSGFCCRHLASSSSSSSNNSNSSARSYLERWAGIRGGVAACGSPSGSVSQLACGAPSPSTRTPPINFFGRTYLLSTVRVPPFPTHTPRGSTPVTRQTNGAAAAGAGQQEERAGKEEVNGEERRAFEWMRGALQGPGALGTTGFFPGEGSPVVLDLGAVSQDGSPHGRPVGPASLAGAVRAVRAAGLVPVGVCNTSHDVLRTASEQGLPEVMMVQARPRSSQQSSAPVTAETLRATRPSAARRPSVHLPASSAEHSSVPAQEPPSDAASDAAAATPIRQDGGDGPSARLRGDPADSASPPSSSSRAESVANSASASLHSPPTPPAAASGVRAATSPGEARAAGTGEEAVGDGRNSRSDSLVEGGAGAGAGGTTGARDSSCEEFGGLPEQTRGPETMVYQGSVRSGQQVFAEGTSLVVLGAVSSGGEVMADGDIHVYGTLRGRALAGLSGNKSAKIFATRFDAELVGVGDTFTTLDDPESLAGLVVDTPTNVCLRDSKLVFRSFDLSATHT